MSYLICCLVNTNLSDIINPYIILGFLIQTDFVFRIRVEVFIVFHREKRVDITALDFYWLDRRLRFPLKKNPILFTTQYPLPPKISI